MRQGFKRRFGARENNLRDALRVAGRDMLGIRTEDELMKDEIRPTMRAVAIDRFGGPEVLKLRTLPVPEVGPGEVLIRVQTAGVGEWDPFEREGGYAEMLGIEPGFPYVLGSEGSVCSFGTLMTIQGLMQELFAIYSSPLASASPASSTRIVPVRGWLPRHRWSRKRAHLVAER